MIELTIGDVGDLIGKPYAPGARGPDAFDCWGVCAEVYRRAGLVLPDYTHEPLTRAQTAALMVGIAADRAEWIETPEAWCFAFDRRRGHVGLYWRGSVLHAARKVGCILQRLNQFAVMYPGTTFARWRD